MILKKVNNDWHILSKDKVSVGDYFICKLDPTLYQLAIPQSGYTWENNTFKVVASSLKKEGLPFISISDVESKIESLKKVSLTQLSEEEQEVIEVFCIKSILDLNKWSHLTQNVKRPYPVFFWNEVDEMISNHRIKEYSYSEIERTEFEVEFEIENGFVKIIWIK